VQLVACGPPYTFRLAPLKLLILALHGRGLVDK
jgi:hypothetical protein